MVDAQIRLVICYWQDINWMIHRKRFLHTFPAGYFKYRSLQPYFYSIVIRNRRDFIIGRRNRNHEYNVGYRNGEDKRNRTPEGFGPRKGIITQFLIESIILTFFGGLVGMILGVWRHMLFQVLTGFPFAFPFRRFFGYRVSAGIGYYSMVSARKQQTCNDWGVEYE